MGVRDCERSHTVKAEIAQALEKEGKNANLARVREAHPEIPRTTFYRWAGEIRKSGMPQQRATRRLRESAAYDTPCSELGYVAKSEDLDELKAEIPAIPNPGDLLNLDIETLATLLQECLQSARRLKRYAEADNGAIRNAKLFLQASEHLRRTVETAGKLHNQFYDAFAAEELLTTFFDRVAQKDPDFVRSILVELKDYNGWAQRINRRMGEAAREP